MPHARIAWKTRRLAGVARRLAGPRGDRAEASVRRVLAVPAGGEDPVVGPSALNNDGVPLQLCLTTRPSGTTLRLLGDPAAHLPLEERFRASAAAVREALVAGGAETLAPLVTRTAELVLPADAQGRAAYRDGFFWVALSPDRPGAAVYLETAPLGREAAWAAAARWLEEILPTPEPAASILSGLAKHAILASVGIEGRSPQAARAKLYFRLAAASSLDALGVDLLGSPAMLRFLALAMGERGVDLDGLVMSVGLSLGDGALVDAKVDLCGHCLAYTVDEWRDLVARCAAEHGLAPLSAGEELAAGDCEVAFLGLGLDAAGGARVNLYLKGRNDDVPPRRGELVAAVDDAVAYLRSIQHVDGRWVDYELPVGPSDGWVTAYVGAALARLGRALGHEEALAAARDGADWLARERGYAAGWGYNDTSGPDADSTAMALGLLSALGREIRDEDRRFLADLWRPRGGGIATFPGPGAWGEAHWDVTPWAYLALAAADRHRFEEDFLSGLRRHRQGDGTWRAYWWRTPFYSTFLTLEALRELGRPEPVLPAPALDRVADNPFDLACALGIARLRGASPAALGPALRRLLDGQRGDGRWPGHPNLRVTDDRCYEPWIRPVGELYRDDAGTLTTATVLRACCHLLRNEPADGRRVA